MLNEHREVLTPIEASKIIRRDTQTLANWRWLCKGPAFIRDGNRVLYLRQDLELWLKERRIVPGKST